MNLQSASLITTYIKLPLRHTRPGISHALYDHWLVASLILLYELINCDIIYMNSLNSVHERVVLYFQYFILALPIAILGPLSQKHFSSVF